MGAGSEQPIPYRLTPAGERVCVMGDLAEQVAAVPPVCALCSHTEGEHGTSGCSNGWGTDCRGCKCVSFVVPVRTLDEMFGVPPLTPSEVAPSKVLAAWVEWPPCADDAGSTAMHAVHASLFAHELVDVDEPTPTGAALLDRARKAGVL